MADQGGTRWIKIFWQTTSAIQQINYVSRLEILVETFLQTRVCPKLVTLNGKSGLSGDIKDARKGMRTRVDKGQGII